MTTPFRLATAAVIGVLAVGGALYLIQPGKPAVGGAGRRRAPAPANHLRPRPPSRPRRPSIDRRAGPMGPGGRSTRRPARRRSCPLGRRLRLHRRHPGLSGLYPRTNTFASTGSLMAARGMHTATRLADGRVLIAGGGPASWSIGGAYLSSAELFDPRPARSATPDR